MRKQGSGTSMIGRLRAARWSRGYFRKMLINVLLITCVPGFLLGIGMHYSIVGQIERELLSQHEEQMRQHARLVDEQLSYLEISLSHWAYEPLFHERMRSIDYTYNFQDVREINQYLLAMEGSHPLLNSVELYINGLEPWLFSPSYTLQKVGDATQIEQYHTWIQHRGALFWGSMDQDSYNPLMLVHRIPGDGPQPFGLLIATLDEAEVRAMLKTPSTQAGGTALLVDAGTGNIFSASDSEEMAGLESQLAQRLGSGEGNSGSFNLDWGQHNYSVSYVTFDRISSDWIYIHAVPTTAITAPVVFISNSIVYVSMAGLLAAALLSMIVSNRIYSPIGKLVSLLRGEQDHASDHGDEIRFLEEQWNKLQRESSSLQMRMDAQVPLLKEGFLLQLTRGYLRSFSEKEIVERMRLLGWDLEGQHAVVVFCRLSGFPHFDTRITYMDEELLTYAAANIMHELAQARFQQADVINYHDLTLGLLLIVPEDAYYREDLLSLCDETAQVVNRLLRLRLTITISKPTPSMSAVPKLLQEAMEATKYREISDRNQVIELELIDQVTQGNAMRYSFALERELIQALRMGQEDEACRVMEAFYAELTSMPGKESIVLQGMLQLLGSILNAILHSGVNPHEVFQGVNMFERLSQIRETSEMLWWMKREVIKPLAEEMMKRSTGSSKQIVETAIQYMHERYMDPNLSLEGCADYTGTNHYTLSKAFKMYTGSNFVDYLTNLRLEKARELLRSTDLKVYDIAERVGYQNGYFNRLFKKTEGITPKQYREQYWRRSAVTREGI